MKRFFLLLCMVILACGCSAIKYSNISPEAINFHPQTIAVLPVLIGNYETAADVADNAVSQALVNTGLFTNIVDALSLKDQLSTSDTLDKDMTEYVQKLNILRISDKELAQKIADTLNVEAFLLASVTSWGYGRLDGQKVGRVGLGVKLICGKSGVIMWIAYHEVIESYWFIKPDLTELSKEVLQLLLKEMPH